MFEKSLQLKQLLFENKELANILEYYSRVEFLAYYLGIRDTILIQEVELPLFIFLNRNKEFKISEVDGTLLISKPQVNYIYDHSKSKQENFGLFLDYPQIAIEDFLNLEYLNNSLLYCLDYKIFRVGKNSLEVVEALPYKYISKELTNGYKEAYNLFLEQFNL